MFNPQHFGLYFSTENLKHLQKNKEREPLKSAWAAFKSATQLKPLPAVQLGGLRFRLEGDAQAGARALELLHTLAPRPVDADKLYWDSLAETLLLTQCFELLRAHPAYPPGQQAQFRDTLFDRVSELNQRQFETSIVESLWLAALNMATGIALEREPVFMKGVDVFRHAVDAEIHPEGYLPKAVDEGPEERALGNQLLAVQALVLMAEMAHHAGLDLWAYDRRGVTVLTAVTYPLYYYFYPENWPWNGEKWKPSEGVRAEAARAIFRQHNGYLEIANRRYETPLKAINMILDELRPIADPYGGGYTTLTHALPVRRGLFG